MDTENPNMETPETPNPNMVETLETYPPKPLNQVFNSFTLSLPETESYPLSETEIRVRLPTKKMKTEGLLGEIMETEVSDKALPVPKKIENLPPDLLRDILSRLPIESLFQTRQVCPSWRSLINDPQHRLSLMHYKRLLQSPDQQPTSLIFLCGMFNTSEWHGLNYLHDLDSLAKATKGKQLPFKSSLKTGLSVVGSCNGFLCVSEALNLLDEKGVVQPPVVILNPVNGDWFKLPNPPNSRLKSNLIFLGFGYVARRDEYKVVRMQDGEIEDGEIESPMRVQVLTLGGSNTWRNLETTTTRDILWSHFFGVHVNGVLHWFTIGGSYFGTAVGMKSFSLEDETFGAVSLPGSTKGKHYHQLYLGELGGCLMVVDYSNKDLQEVWLMKDDGGKMSWIRQYIIRVPPPHPNLVGMRPEIRPLCMQKNGNFLLHYDIELFSYDPNTKTHQLLTVPGLSFVFTATTHVGTLVTLGDVFSMEKIGDDQSQDE